jgi:D-alanine-D-alanine ligase
VKKSEWQTRSAEITKEVSSLGYPVFVKPARGGSSRGTSKVKSEDDFAAAVLDAFSFDPKIMIEKAIVGSEIECAVLEIDGQPQASIVGKIVIDSKFEFYDFEAKYLDGATDIELPAPITATAAEAIRSSAIAAFKALGCSGLARVDFFLTNSGQVIINELNTMPGFTSTSVFPKMWAVSGVSYTELISHLLQSALARTNGPLGN